MFAPSMMRKIMAEVRTASVRLSLNLLHVSFRRTKAMKKAPKAPIPAASTGLKMPK